jgi:hypothetical protein
MNTTVSAAPSAVVFEDGLGERRHTTGAANQPLEVLILHEELTAIPAFETSLRERLDQLAAFQHPSFARVRGAGRLTKGQARLIVASDHVPGVRLSEMLTAAEQRLIPLEIDAALCLLRQIVPAIAALHAEAPDACHGALAPERIILTPDARAVVVEYIYGSALEQLRFSHARYWKELRIPLPPTGGLPRFDRRADVTQLGAIALALILGRPLGEDEYPSRVADIVDGVRAISATGLEVLPAGIRSWLSRTLQLDPRRSFANAIEAQAELELIAGFDDRRLRDALESFLEQYRLSETDAAGTDAASDPLPAAISVAHAADMSPSDEDVVKTAAPTVLPDQPAIVPERPAIASESRSTASHWPSLMPDRPTNAPERPDTASDWRPIASERPAVTPEQPAATSEWRPMASERPATAPDRPAATPEWRPMTAERPTIAPPAVSSDWRPIASERPAIAPERPAITPDRPPVVSQWQTIAPEPAAAPESATAAAKPEAVAPYPSTLKSESSKVASEWPAIGSERPALITEDRAMWPGAATTTLPDPSDDASEASPEGRSWRGRLIAAAVVLIALGTGGTLAARKIMAPPPVGTLAVNSNPAGAQVIIDGEPKGRTPITLALPPGEHILALSADGQTRTIPVTIASGGQVAQFIELPTNVVAEAAPAPAPVPAPPVAAEPAGAALVVAGWISIAAPIDVQVFERGRLVGTSQSERIMLGVGRHELDLSNEALGYRATRIVQVTPGKVTPIAIDLPKGSLALNASPWAEVWVDGEKVGETPIGNVAVSIGTHDVLFRHPELGEQRHAVTVTLAGPARVSATFKKP